MTREGFFLHMIGQEIPADEMAMGGGAAGLGIVIFVHAAATLTTALIPLTRLFKNLMGDHQMIDDRFGFLDGARVLERAELFFRPIHNAAQSHDALFDGNGNRARGDARIR